MIRLAVSVLFLILLFPFSAQAQNKCAIAQDYLVRARERCYPGATQTEVKEALQLLTFANDRCDRLGDAWYYRYLCEKRLGNLPAATRSLARAKEYRSGAYNRSDDPFTLSTSPGAITAGQSGASQKVREKWALVVGISNFQNHSASRPMNLKFAAKDAQDFSGFLTDPNYGRFKSTNVRLLTDSQATTDAIMQGLNWLAQNAGKDDLAVVYFSSHGTKPSESEGSYLVTYNTATTEGKLAETALPMVEIVDAVQSRIKAERAVVFIDTCYSGYAITGPQEIAGSKALTIESNSVPKNLLERFGQGVGRIIISASQSNELSWESTKVRSGIFTYHLIGELKQESGQVPVEQTYQRLREKVNKQAFEEWGRPQNPAMRKSDSMPEIRIGIVTQAGQSLSVAAQDENPVGAKALFYNPESGAILKPGEKKKDPRTGRARVKKALPGKAKFIGLNYWIELVGKGHVTADHVFRTGDRIKLHIRSNVDGYLSLWSLDSSGRGKPLFPESGQVSEKNFVEADTEHISPEKGKCITFAPPVEDERLLVFFSTSKTNLFPPARKQIDSGEVEKALNSNGSKSLVIETDKTSADEVGDYVVNKNGGSIIKEIRLKHRPR